MRSPFQGKSVLISGAAGSIGSELCRRVASEGASKLTLVSLTEGGLYNAERQLRKDYSETKFVPVVGSCGNRTLMLAAMQASDTQIVIHAGAHKHVPLCEQNPVEAILNNVFGTMGLAQAAADAGVAQFCMISSDKAVKPASIMGATKRLAELLVDEMSVPKTDYFIVRFGNVMDSAGSVIPLWREQVARGEPITITDERCERYFMSIPQAVDLICRVIGAGPAHGIYVLNMGKPKRLVDIARQVMVEAGTCVPLKMIGLRPGEKLTEELHHGGTLEKTEIAKVFQVDEPYRDLVDRERLCRLARACGTADREEAVRLLWELVA